MDIEQEYISIVNDLTLGKRALRKWNDDQIYFLLKSWDDNSHDLNQILCLIDHSQKPSLAFSSKIISSLKEEIDHDKIILLLSLAQKHILGHSFQMGERVPFDFLETLKILLKNDHPEVLEWTLRTIEQIGSQSIFLKEDVLNSRPRWKKFFNQHHKASSQIIELLEKRWKI